jgi:hypothetical protein
MEFKHFQVLRETPILRAVKAYPDSWLHIISGGFRLPWPLKKQIYHDT